MATITKEMLNKMAKRDKFKAPDWNECSGNEIREYVKRIVELDYFTPYHGEGFYWLGESYRNNNLLFWHKEKGVKFPYGEIDDYGSVPPCFLVGNGPDNFHPQTWLDVVDHNSIIFLTKEVIDEIGEKLSASTHEYYKWSCVVTIKGSDYNVFMNDPEVLKTKNYCSIENGALYFF